MIKNYWTSALANLRKNKLSAAINITGLSISLAALVIIALFIRRELAFDTSHPNAERLYRITETINSGSYIENSSSCPFPVADALTRDFPDYIETVVRLFDFQLPVKSMKLENNELYNETHIFYADSNVFDVLDIPLKVGSPKEVLNAPFNIVISEELSQKWFGNEDPLGKSVYLAGQDKFKCTITGVFAPGGPSHFSPRAIISMSTATTIAPFLNENWIWNPHWTYIKLKEGINPSSLETQFPSFVQKNYSDQWKDMISHKLQPIGSIHLDSHLEFEMSQNSDRKYIYIFLSCAVFLIVIAIVNFVNLTTVGLTARVKEVGVRKVSGASRGQLIGQFIFESVLLTLISFTVALILLFLLYPLVADTVNLRIPFDELFDPGLLMIMAGAVVLTGIVSGIYPALVISRTNTVEIFKGGLRGDKRGQLFRKGLVIFQFGIALVLIVFTFMANRQLSFMQDHNKGYTTENIITLTMASTPLPSQLEAFRQELQKDSRVLSMSIMNETIGINNNNHEFNFGDMPEGEWRYIPALMVDEHFGKTVGIKMVAGRDYDPTLTTEDSLSVVINRSMAEYLGYQNPEDAIGQSCHSISGDERIVGVAENFHFKSLHHPVGPFILDVESRNQYNFYLFAKHIVMRLSETSPDVLAHVEDVWKKFVKNAPFSYQVLDQELEAVYRREATMGRVLTFFSILAILIACLGLFALTWSLARLKSKEMAIRKVLGAEMSQLIYVATKEQMTMVILSLVIGFPVAFWVINDWLSSFAYRTEQDAGAYLISGIVSISIAFLTILFLAIRSARKDPAMVLKYE
jgi:putative ABC transport system permease protein